jgi:hypothetical protein
VASDTIETKLPGFGFGSLHETEPLGSIFDDETWGERDGALSPTLGTVDHGAGKE